MASREIPGARVAIRYAGAETAAEADDEGHFHTWVVPSEPPGEGIWQAAEIDLVEPAGHPVRATSKVLVPDPAARFGVISDIDDTVIQAGVANLLRLVGDVVLGSVHTREPFPGVAAFFRALHRGVGRAPNPVFYVSNGPWNLYDVFVHFLELHGIPAGPVELRDWGALWNEVRRIGRYAHKRAAIRRIFTTLPSLSFLLVGDSGEEDPEIYRDVVHEFPARVQAVYIRDVHRDPLRRREIHDLAEEVSAAGSALVLAEDTLAAARHAADHGWIEASAVDRVAADRPHPGTGRSVIVEGGEDRG